MKRIPMTGLLLCALYMAASGAIADECKQVFAWVDAVAFTDEGCSYDGFDYIYCSEARLSGNLQGIWYAYGSPELTGWETLTVPDDALGIDGWDVWGFWNLGVIETKRGKITLQGTNFANVSAYLTYGAVSSTLSVLGGTRAYEGVTGWLGIIGNDFTARGLMWGEVCVP